MPEGQNRQDAWAGLTHQRYTLRRVTLVRPLDLRSIALAVGEVSDLAKRVEADALLCVSQLVLKRIAALQDANHAEARLIYPLIDALDRACLEAMEFNADAG